MLLWECGAPRHGSQACTYVTCFQMRLGQRQLPNLLCSCKGLENIMLASILISRLFKEHDASQLPLLHKHSFTTYSTFFTPAPPPVLQRSASMCLQAFALCVYHALLHWLHIAQNHYVCMAVSRCRYILVLGLRTTGTWQLLWLCFHKTWAAGPSYNPFACVSGIEPPGCCMPACLHEYWCGMRPCLWGICTALGCLKTSRQCRSEAHALAWASQRPRDVVEACIGVSTH